MRREWKWAAIAIGLVLVAGSATLNWTASAGALQTDDAAAPPTDRGGGFDFSMLVHGLRATPGCLGVEVAQFQSGKLSIFAWFEDRAAVMRWYEHPVHQGAKSALLPVAPPEGYQPLEHITDETKPIMVVATLTPNQSPSDGAPPLQQISIELYQPLPGGLAVGGRLAPDSFAADHLRTIDHASESGN